MAAFIDNDAFIDDDAIVTFSDRLQLETTKRETSKP